MREIQSCPGYFATADGVIFSTSTGRELGGTVDRYGYQYVNIMVGGLRVKRKVHRLVCEAWHGICPHGHECGHLDGDRLNNRPDNLRWVTRSENMKHQIAHGTFAGAKNLVHVGWVGSRKRPTDTIADAVRRDAKEGMGGRRLAAKYGIDRSTAYRIVYTRTA